MSVPSLLFNASPAKAGVQLRAVRYWTPAFAGEAWVDYTNVSGDAA